MISVLCSRTCGRHRPKALKRQAVQKARLQQRQRCQGSVTIAVQASATISNFVRTAVWPSQFELADHLCRGSEVPIPAGLLKVEGIEGVMKVGLLLLSFSYCIFLNMHAFVLEFFILKTRSVTFVRLCDDSFQKGSLTMLCLIRLALFGLCERRRLDTLARMVNSTFAGMHCECLNSIFSCQCVAPRRKTSIFCGRTNNVASFCFLFRFDSEWHHFWMYSCNYIHSSLFKF